MKRIRSFIVFSMVLFFATGAWSQNSFIEKIEAGPNFTYNLGIGSVSEHENGNAAFGVNAYYPFFNLPWGAFGLSGCGEFGAATGKQDYVDSWFVVNALAGVYMDFTFSQVIIRPEFDFGMALNIVNSNERNVHGPQADTMLRAGCSVIWQPEFMKDFAFYGGANYSFMPEKDNIGNFVGFKAGVLYRKSKSSNASKTESSKSEE